MKKKILLGTALTVTIVICCILSFNFYLKVFSAGNDNNQPKTIFSFQNEIGLSNDQETKLKALLYDDHNAHISYKDNLNILSLELTRMISQKDDLRLIKKKLEEMSKIQVEISYRDIATSRKIEEILSPKQLDKWQQIKERETNPKK